MAFEEHEKSFAGKKIFQFPAEKIPKKKPLNKAIRLGAADDEYDLSDDHVPNQMKALAATSWAAEVDTMVVGFWGSDPTVPSDAVVKALVAHKDKLTGLRHLFVGDIHYEESELSWIEHRDLAPILSAYPSLETLKIRGGSGLRLKDVAHDSLKSLTIECSGLSKKTLKDVLSASLPSLESLELWLGNTDYGCDIKVKELDPLLSGHLFPRLKHLGLRCAPFGDALAAKLGNAPILSRINSLDLSGGTIGDKGGKALCESAAISALNELTIVYHFMSEPVSKKLKELCKGKAKIDEGDAEQEEDEDRYPDVGE